MGALAVMALFTPACLVMFPRPLITLAAVIAFGPWLGFAYSLAGIVVSSVVTYYIGRRMRRDTVRRLAGEKLDRMAEVLKKHGLLAMTLLRLVPLAPFAIESIVAGAIHMRVWHVALGTAIGLIPGTLATTIFGDQIETALSGGTHQLVGSRRRARPARRRRMGGEPLVPQDGAPDLDHECGDRTAASLTGRRWRSSSGPTACASPPTTSTAAAAATGRKTPRASPR